MTYTRRLTAFLATSAALGLTAQVGDAPAAAPKETSAYDDIWRLAKLYDNKDNTLIQEVSFVGRYMGQYAIIAKVYVPLNAGC